MSRIVSVVAICCLSVFVFLTLSASSAFSFDSSGSGNYFTGECLPRISLNVNGNMIQAELATGTAVNQGLMFRTSLPWNQGMLFVFQPPRRTAMWMYNTYIPLSVAFLDQYGTILNIKDMKPLSEELHFSDGVAAFALEMNQSWFSEYQIVPGDKVTGLELVEELSENY